MAKIEFDIYQLCFPVNMSDAIKKTVKKTVTWRQPPQSKIQFYDPALEIEEKPISLAPTGDKRLTTKAERIEYFKSLDKLCIPREAVKRFINTIMADLSPATLLNADAIIHVHQELESFIVSLIQRANLVTAHGGHKKVDIIDIALVLKVQQTPVSFDIDEMCETAIDDTKKEDTIGIPNPSMERLWYRAGASFVTSKGADFIRLVAQHYITEILSVALDRMSAASRKTITVVDFKDYESVDE